MYQISPSFNLLEPSRMKLVDHYPLITTTAHTACRDFYVRHFGFEVAFEASWFVFLNRPAGEGESAMSLAFMTPDHPSKPPGPEIFSTGVNAGRVVGRVTRRPLPSRTKFSGSPPPRSSTRRTSPALVGPEAARLSITSSPSGQAIGRA